MNKIVSLSKNVWTALLANTALNTDQLGIKVVDKTAIIEL